MKNHNALLIFYLHTGQRRRLIGIVLYGKAAQPKKLVEPLLTDLLVVQSAIQPDRGYGKRLVKTGFLSTFYHALTGVKCFIGRENLYRYPVGKRNILKALIGEYLHHGNVFFGWIAIIQHIAGTHQRFPFKCGKHLLFGFGQ